MGPCGVVNNLSKKGIMKRSIAWLAACAVVVVTASLGKAQGPLCLGYRCDEGKACYSGRDCISHVCRPASRMSCAIGYGPCSGTCVAPTCDDHVHNGYETGVDCGGSCARKCSSGQGCATAEDCDSGVCTETVCQPATCLDKTQNNGEADIDCGGPCKPCSCDTPNGHCIMFVTSVSQSGDMRGLAGADATCNSRAAIAGLIPHYQAWLCDGVDAPANRSVHAKNARYVRTDGVVIANNWDDLTDGSIASPINRTEDGTDVSTIAPLLPWTNVLRDGTCNNNTYASPGFGPCPVSKSCKMNCAADVASTGWTSSSLWAQGQKGDINLTDHFWTEGVSGLCSVPAERIYCIEQ